ncbi:MAG: hypothetical protein DSY78_05015 [Chloroflexi bacterium]|nr:MAG: hypothetical protein DSY78_05015 [Chloroflexota bacterium]
MVIVLLISDSECPKFERLNALQHGYLIRQVRCQGIKKASQASWDAVNLDFSIGSVGGRNRCQIHTIYPAYKRSRTPFYWEGKLC